MEMISSLVGVSEYGGKESQRSFLIKVGDLWPADPGREGLFALGLLLPKELKLDCRFHCKGDV